MPKAEHARGAGWPPKLVHCSVAQRVTPFLTPADIANLRQTCKELERIIDGEITVLVLGTASSQQLLRGIAQRAGFFSRVGFVHVNGAAEDLTGTLAALRQLPSLDGLKLGFTDRYAYLYEQPQMPRSAELVTSLIKLVLAGHLCTASYGLKQFASGAQLRSVRELIIEAGDSWGNNIHYLSGDIARFVPNVERLKICGGSFRIDPTAPRLVHCTSLHAPGINILPHMGAKDIHVVLPKLTQLISHWSRSRLFQAHLVPALNHCTGLSCITAIGCFEPADNGPFLWGQPRTPGLPAGLVLPSLCLPFRGESLSFTSQAMGGISGLSHLSALSIGGSGVRHLSFEPGVMEQLVQMSELVRINVLVDEPCTHVTGDRAPCRECGMRVLPQAYESEATADVEHFRAMLRLVLPPTDTYTVPGKELNIARL